MGVSRWSSGYQLEVTCTSPFLLEGGGKCCCFAWGMENAHMLRDLTSCLFLSAKVRGEERGVYVGCHLKAASITCLNCDPLQWREVNPLFLRKRSHPGCAGVRNVQPSKSQVFHGQGSCGNTQRLFLSHPPPGIVMKPSWPRWSWALSDLISLPTSPVLPPLSF